METKQAEMFEKYGIGNYEGYWLDGEKRTLKFISHGETELIFQVVYIGTWSHLNHHWMWAWNNSSLTEEIRDESARIKALEQETGYEVFHNDGFNCDEEMAYELTSMALHELKALGMYRVPGERSHLFLALMSKI